MRSTGRLVLLFATLAIALDSQTHALPGKPQGAIGGAQTVPLPIPPGGGARAGFQYDFDYDRGLRIRGTAPYAYTGSIVNSMP